VTIYRHDCASWHALHRPHTQPFVSIGMRSSPPGSQRPETDRVIEHPIKRCSSGPRSSHHRPGIYSLCKAPGRTPRCQGYRFRSPAPARLYGSSRAHSGDSALTALRLDCLWSPSYSTPMSKESINTADCSTQFTGKPTDEGTISSNCPKQADTVYNRICGGFNANSGQNGRNV
jgi:hypothetical protein